MSETTASTARSWYVYHQGHLEYYDSQQAVLAALDSIVASYESGVWKPYPYLSLNYEQGVVVDNELFDSRFSAKSLIPDKDRSFTIDVYVKNKEDWVFKYGSDLLQQSILAGYECNDGYLAERVAHDYPGFKINKNEYQKVDTPNEWCLYACLGYENAHCSFDHKHWSRNKYYITIDNFLGKYQLIKPIDSSLKIAKDSSTGKIVVSNSFATKIGRYMISLDFDPVLLGSLSVLFLSILVAWFVYDLIPIGYVRMTN